VPGRDLVPIPAWWCGCGEQVALFYLPGHEQALYAIDNRDPRSGANIIGRGLVGSLQGELVVAAPLYKQHFSLQDGRCLEDAAQQLRVWPVRVVAGQVEIGLGNLHLLLRQAGSTGDAVPVGAGLPAMRPVQPTCLYGNGLQHSPAQIHCLMNLDTRIKFRHLLCFLEIARQGSLARAADVLAISQPAISKTLKELEDLLEARLFERTHLGVNLTPAGTRFMRYAGPSVQALRDGVGSVRGDARTPSQVRIGVLSTVEGLLMPEVLCRLHQRHEAW
jgi:NAD(P)H-dependent nitrite reductase small subunit